MQRNSTNAIRDFIHSWLLKPSYAVMLISVIIRALIGLVAASLLPYNRWPSLMRVGLEVVVMLGVVISGEIIFSAAAMGEAALRRQRGQCAAETFVIPTQLRGKRDEILRQIEAQRSAFAQSQAARLAALDAEIGQERRMLLFFGAISTVYGVNFALQSALPPSFPLYNMVNLLMELVMEVASIITVPMVIYYYSARLHDETPDPAAVAEDKSVSAIVRQVEVAGERVNAGDYDNSHVDMLSAPLPASHPFHRALGLLRKQEQKWLSTAQVFATFGIVEESARRTFRARLAKLPRALAYTSGERGEWQINPAAVFQLLDGLVGVTPATASARSGSGAGAAIARNTQSGEPAVIQASLPMSPENTRISSGDANAAPLQPEATHAGTDALARLGDALARLGDALEAETALAIG